MTRLRLFAEGSHRPINARAVFVAVWTWMRIKQPAFMWCKRGVTIIRLETYAKAQVVDVYGLIPVCHETHVS